MKEMRKSKFPFVSIVHNIRKLLIVSCIFSCWLENTLSKRNEITTFQYTLILTQSRGQFTAGIAAVESVSPLFLSRECDVIVTPPQKHLEKMDNECWRVINDCFQYRKNETKNESICVTTLLKVANWSPWLNACKTRFLKTTVTKSNWK